MKILNNKYKKEFDNTSKSKFRDIDNINPTCSLLHYYYYYNKLFNLIKINDNI